MRYLIIFSIIISGCKVYGQELNLDNFLGKDNKKINIYSSSFIVTDTGNLFKSGKNLNWDFSKFKQAYSDIHYIEELDSFKSYQFLPGDSALFNKYQVGIGVDTLKNIDKVIQVTNGKMIKDQNGYDTLGIVEHYFRTYGNDSIVNIGLSNSYIGGYYTDGYWWKKKIFNPISFGYGNKGIIDSVIQKDTITGTGFYQISHFGDYYDATGDITFPSGIVENCLRQSEYYYYTLIFTSLIDGRILSIDTLMHNETYKWFAPNQHNSIPICEVYYQKKNTITGATTFISTMPDEQSILNFVSEENFTPKEGFSLYPNPSKNVLTISHFGEAKKVKVFSVNGNLLISKTLQETKHQLDVSNLPKGLYFVSIYDNLGVVLGTKKFVKYE